VNNWEGCKIRESWTIPLRQLGLGRADAQGHEDKEATMWP